MDEKRVCAAISNWLEPRETLPEVVWSSTVGMHVPSRANVRPGEQSPKGGWKIGPGMKWIPFDWLHDEAANARLFKWLVDKAGYEGINIWARHQDSYDGKTVYGVNVESHMRATYDTQEADSLQGAIVEAFLKVAGITLADYE